MSKGYVRWYDSNKTLAKAIEMLEAFPEPIQAIIAEGIINLAEKQCEAREIFDSLKSLGTDKVLALYKSKHKRRTYDQNPTVHKAINYLFVLSDDNRMLMAKHIIELIDYIYDYLKTCQTFKSEPSLEELTEMTVTYIEKGGSDAVQFLEEVKARFQAAIRSLPGESNPSVSENKSGMSIKDTID